MSGSQGYICLACGCVLSSMNTDWMHGVRDEHTIEVRNMFLKAQGEDPENKLARLNHQNAHIVHKSAKTQYKAVVETDDQEDDESLAASDDAPRGRFRLPSKLDEDDIEPMCDQTDLFCTGCNAIPTSKDMIYDRIELLSRGLLVKFKGHGARFVALLIVQITVTMDQRRNTATDNVVNRHKFNAGAVIAYYASLVMFCMFVEGHSGWESGHFQLWHNYFFSDMVMHDKHGQTLIEALEAPVIDETEWKLANLDDEQERNDEINEFRMPPEPIAGGTDKYKATYRSFYKTAHNIVRLYAEHWQDVKHFLHGITYNNIHVWSLSPERAQQIDGDMRMSSLERFFHRKGSNAWSMLLMRFIIVARDTRADYTNESELGGQLLARIAPLAIGTYDIFAVARALRRP